MPSKSKKQVALVAAAMALFAVKKEESVAACLWALNLRDTCGRCGGCGNYSFTPRYGSTCFGCNGRGTVPTKLTADVLEAARVKVEAGELEAHRAAYRAKMAAKKELAPMIAAAREIYLVIGNAYTVASNVKNERREGESDDDFADRRVQATRDFVDSSAIFKAQGLNNDLQSAVWALEFAVKQGDRRDYLEVKRELEALIADLVTLRDAYLAFAGK